MDYCNVVQGFINYALSNLKNISGEGIRCLCKKCKNKKFFDLVVATQFLTHVLINFLKNPKIAKNIENPKNTFLIHLHRF
jgi:hypothetical protein